MISALEIATRTEVRPAYVGPNFRTTKENSEMLLYEDLARARMREAERDAAQRRQARQLMIARRWRRVAAWSTRRAKRAECALPPGLVPADVR